MMARMTKLVPPAKSRGIYVRLGTFACGFEQHLPVNLSNFKENAMEKKKS